MIGVGSVRSPSFKWCLSCLYVHVFCSETVFACTVFETESMDSWHAWSRSTGNFVVLVEVSNPMKITPNKC